MSHKDVLDDSQGTGITPQPAKRVAKLSLKEVGAFLASGLFALAFGASISAIQIAGVISMKAAHKLMFFAWFFAVAAVLTTERVLSKSRKHIIVTGLLSAVALGIVLLGLDGWMVNQRAEQERAAVQPQRASSTDERHKGFLQFDRVEILGDYSAIAPGRQFGGNLYSLNPGTDRVFNAYGYSQAYVEDVDEQTDHRVQILFEKELMPHREKYLLGGTKGPEEGVGRGIWTTVLTRPLTQREVNGIVEGTVRVYFVSWLAWTDSRGHKDSAYDCRWLQAHTLPAPYGREDIIWHFCKE